jgi:hypothetical protein
MGALGLYLMLRFDITNELEEIDFTDNSNWFDFKLLVDRTVKNTSGSTKKQMSLNKPEFTPFYRKFSLFVFVSEKNIAFLFSLLFVE